MPGGRWSKKVDDVRRMEDEEGRKPLNSRAERAIAAGYDLLVAVLWSSYRLTVCCRAYTEDSRQSVSGDVQA